MTPLLMYLLVKANSITTPTLPKIMLAAPAAAIALPHYQDYIAKTQVTRIVGELAAAKDLIDASLFDGKIPNLEVETTNPKEEAIGMLVNGHPRTTLVSKIEFVGKIQTGANGGIQATIGNKAHKTLQGLKVGQYRSAKTGVWHCLIDPSNALRWKNKFTPSGCELKNVENLEYDW